MSFHIIRNDITKVKADAIVNTANPNPIYGGGTDTAIYMAAGAEALLAERKKIGKIARGEAVYTPAFNLNAKYIIHTVGPAWKGGGDGEFDILKNCYDNSLRLAKELKCKSIAFPLIATGIYGFPKDKALQIAMSSIQAFLMDNDMSIILVVFDDKAFQLSGNIVDNIREYVDSNYVEMAHKREYHRRERRSAIFEDADISEVECMSICAASTNRLSAVPEKIRIEDLLASSDKTFQEKLFELIDERNLSGPEVYRNYISKQVYSKLQSDKDYHPNKYTAIALCLSLQLDVDQTIDLLGRAGWTLSPSNKADIVVKGCIINKEYNITKINLILYDFGCQEIEKIK